MAYSQIELRLLRMPTGRLRLCLALLLLVTPIALPNWIGGLVIWIVVLRYVPLSGAMASALAGQRVATQRAEAESREREARLHEHATRIGELETELARERTSARTRSSGEDDPLYRQVGLHHHAPDWLIAGVRRTYRARLHPDRHPHHREQAHERYLRAETVFAAIYRRRGL